MIKKILLLIGVALSVSPNVIATVTLNFSSSGARAIGFLDNGGNGVSGMRFGIVIDSANDGFSEGDYASFNFDQVLTPSTVLNLPLLAGGFSNDYYFANNTATVASIGASGADAGGAGAIGSLPAAPLTSDLTGTQGFTGASSYSFGIIWFDNTTSGGPYYGFYTDPSFVLPASGTSVNFSTPFVGTSGPGDIPKSATYVFAAPEPSRTVLAFFGLAMVGLRRRRR